VSARAENLFWIALCEARPPLRVRTATTEKANARPLATLGTGLPGSAADRARPHTERGDLPHRGPTDAGPPSRPAGVRIAGMPFARTGVVFRLRSALPFSGEITVRPDVFP